MKNLVKTLFIYVLMVALSITAADAKEFYVAKNGIDNNDGSENNPWLTIHRAASTAHAGDTVYIKNGIYAEVVTVQNSGSDEN